MIPFTNRFHGHSSLSYVYKNGEAIRSKLLTLKFVGNKHRKQSRVAVVVSKKVLKSAVRRNRIRRRIYEHIHPMIKSFSSVYDVVFIVSSAEIFAMGSSELSDQLDQVIGQSNICKKSDHRAK
ncbi:ribonuclease P protein component [Candidatus Saccharibacteria bacterium]|nr:ribonuclease P protein component [Candidatus Saccharibacteria bacterium]